MAAISQITHAARSGGIFEGVKASIMVSNGCCVRVMFHQVLSMVLFKEGEFPFFYHGCGCFSFGEKFQSDGFFNGVIVFLSVLSIIYDPQVQLPGSV